MVKFHRVWASLLTLLVSSTAFADAPDKWRILDNNNLVLMTLPYGQVVIELAPQFSPKHVTQFRALVKKGVYNGNKFYRVIDGFVAQVGPSEKSAADNDISPLKLEGDWDINEQWQMTLVQAPDLFAEQTGFIDGFALAANPSEKKAWLAHCPGMVAMARGNSADSATSHFYINNGQAPRYLDRIMTIFGRVVYGMHHVQAIQRTQMPEGDESVAESALTSLVTMQLMSELPIDQQWQLAVENTESPEFVDKLVKRKHREHAFFFKKPPPVLDICQVPVGTKIIKR